MGLRCLWFNRCQNYPAFSYYYICNFLISSAINASVADDLERCKKGAVLFKMASMKKSCEIKGEMTVMVKNLIATIKV